MKSCRKNCSSTSKCKRGKTSATNRTRPKQSDRRDCSLAVSCAQRKNAANALLTLGLGIGANTASFSVVYGVLLEPMPYPSADRIGKVWLHFSPQNLPHGPLSVADYLDWRARNHAFENLSAFTNSFFDLRGVGTPRQVAGASVTSGFFSIMQVPPILGRTFQPGEDSGTSASLVVIGESLWRRVFGADKSVIGRAIELNGSQATVIGVMPDSF